MNRGAAWGWFGGASRPGHSSHPPRPFGAVPLVLASLGDGAVRFVRVLAVMLVGATLALGSGCARRSDVSDWLARAEAAHRATRIDCSRRGMSRGRGARFEARRKRPLRAKRALPMRARSAAYPYARLATLEAEHGAPEEAVRVATAGLALGRGEDAFTASLGNVAGPLTRAPRRHERRQPRLS